mgnify:CR=1 FL=1
MNKGSVFLLQLEYNNTKSISHMEEGSGEFSGAFFLHTLLKVHFYDVKTILWARFRALS